jgi:predicted ArsR family transcriptional regulator
VQRFERAIGPLTALGDDLRRRMYLYVRGQERPVSREEVAGAVGVSRKLAAFHLDKLAEKGLLTYEYERPPGRTGPGAGRPAKVYRPSEMQLEVSIPERRYDLLGRLLVDAIRPSSYDGSPADHAVAIAREAGLRLGESVRRERQLHRPGAKRTLAVVEEVLEEHGFQPYRQGQELRLRNCPFQALSRHAPDLVCRMNEAFIEGLVRGIGNETVTVVLEPKPGQCCVKLRYSRSGTAEVRAPS